MADEPLHYPGQEHEEAPAPETPKEEPKPEEAPAPEDKAPEAPKPEEKPEEKKDEPTPDAPLQKKRSIYDDLKDTRKELKETKAKLKELEGGDKPAEKPAEKPADAPAPKEEPKPANELDAYAEENGLDAKQLSRLAAIIAKQVPQSQLSDADLKELSDLKDWKATKVAEEQRASEDNAIRAEASKVKAELQIHDDAELSAVMDEIVKLAHSERFHDKEVAYIVWANRDALAKLVSPKKPSFESGQETAPGAEPKEVVFSGKMTPESAQKELHASGPKSQLEIRKGS